MNMEEEIDKHISVLRGIGFGVKETPAYSNCKDNINDWIRLGKEARIATHEISLDEEPVGHAKIIIVTTFNDEIRAHFFTVFPYEMKPSIIKEMYLLGYVDGWYLALPCITYVIRNWEDEGNSFSAV